MNQLPFNFLIPIQKPNGRFSDPGGKLNTLMVFIFTQQETTALMEILPVFAKF